MDRKSPPLANNEGCLNYVSLEQPEVSSEIKLFLNVTANILTRSNNARHRALSNAYATEPLETWRLVHEFDLPKQEQNQTLIENPP